MKTNNGTEREEAHIKSRVWSNNSRGVAVRPGKGEMKEENSVPQKLLREFC